ISGLPQHSADQRDGVMSNDDFELPRELDVDLERQIDAVCTQFEQQWRSGQAARIEDFLEQIPGVGRDRGLCELLALEFELQRESGEAVDIAGYLDRFLDKQPLVRKAFALAEPTLWIPAGVDTAEDMPAPSVALPAELPRQLGRFRIEKKIGQG